MTITLHGEPKSASHIYKYHCKFGRPSGYMSAEGKALKYDYQMQALAQWRSVPLTGPLKVTATLFFGTKRKQDIDNYSKLVLDALTGIVWEDDSQIVEMTVRKEYDKKEPRVELEVERHSLQV